MYAIRETQRLTQRCTLRYSSRVEKERPSSAFVSLGGKYTGRMPYDPELLQQDIHFLARSMVPLATLKDVRNKLQPRARAKWDAQVELAEHQIHQYEQVYEQILNQAFLLEADLPTGRNFGTWQGVLLEFIRKNTMAPNVGSDWELDLEEEEAVETYDSERETLIEQDVEEEDDAPKTREERQWEESRFKLLGWWEQPFLVLQFRTAPEPMDYDEYLSTLREQLDGMIEGFAENMIMKTLQDALNSLQFRNTFEEYAKNAPQLSSELGAKLEKLVDSLPESTKPKKSGTTIQQELDADTQQIEGAVDLKSVDPAYKAILKQSIRDSVTNLPDLGFHKFIRAAERKAIRKIFAKGIELAREDKLPQLIPCLQLFRDIILLPKLEGATAEVLDTLQKDVPGLTTFLGYRVMGDSQYVRPKIPFSLKQATRYCRRLRLLLKEQPAVTKEEEPASEEPLSDLLLPTDNVDLEGTPKALDLLEEINKESEDLLFDQDESPDLPTGEDLESPSDYLVKKSHRFRDSQRVAIVSFQHAKILLSEAILHNDTHSQDPDPHNPVVRQRILDIPPQWLWAFKKVKWPPVSPVLMRQENLLKHAPTFNHRLDDEIAHRVAKLSE